MSAQSLADLRLSRTACGLWHKGMELEVVSVVALLSVLSLLQLQAESRLTAVAVAATAAAAAAAEAAAPLPKAAEKDERRRDEEERRKCILAFSLASSEMVSVRGLFAACSSSFLTLACAGATKTEAANTATALLAGDAVFSLLNHPAAAEEEVVSESSSEEKASDLEFWPPGASCLPRPRLRDSLLSTRPLRAATSSGVQRFRVASTQVRPVHTSLMVFAVTPNLGASVLQCWCSGVPRVFDGRSS